MVSESAGQTMLGIIRQGEEVRDGRGLRIVQDFIVEKCMVAGCIR